MLTFLVGGAHLCIFVWEQNELYHRHLNVRDQWRSRLCNLELKQDRNCLNLLNIIIQDTEIEGFPFFNIWTKPVQWWVSLFSIIIGIAMTLKQALTVWLIFFFNNNNNNKITIFLGVETLLDVLESRLLVLPVLKPEPEVNCVMSRSPLPQTTFDPELLLHVLRLSGSNSLTSKVLEDTPLCVDWVRVSDIESV